MVLIFDFQIFTAFNDRQRVFKIGVKGFSMVQWGREQNGHTKTDTVWSIFKA